MDLHQDFPQFPQGGQVLDLRDSCSDSVCHGYHCPYCSVIWVKKDPEQIGSVIGGGAVVFAMISLGLFIVMVCFAHPISVIMQAPARSS